MPHEFRKRDKRSDKRVILDHKIDCTVVAVDGTWSIPGWLDDISDTGAKFSTPRKIDDHPHGMLTVESSGLPRSFERFA